MRDEYVAGFWKKWLLWDLMWERRGEVRERPATGYPSWSWLSINSGVKLPREAYPDLKRPTPVARILDHRIECRQGGDEFGLLQQASITIRGFLVAVTPDWPGQRFSRDGPGSHETKFMAQPLNRITTDVLFSHEVLPPAGSASANTATDHGSVWALPITLASESMSPTGSEQDTIAGNVVWGLLLCRTQEGLFRRIGRFTSCMGDEETLLAGPRQDITII
jgi:hypothetical protein